MNTKQTSMRTLNLAMRIADGACRSDIECNALGFHHPEGYYAYDLKQSHRDGNITPEDALRNIQIAADARAYIDLRGDALPFRMVRQFGVPYIVHFVLKEPA